MCLTEQIVDLLSGFLHPLAVVVELFYKVPKFGLASLQLTVHLMLGHAFVLGQHLPHLLIRSSQRRLPLACCVLELLLQLVHLKYDCVGPVDLQVQYPQLVPEFRLFQIPLLLWGSERAAFVNLLQTETAYQAAMVGAEVLHQLVVFGADMF